MLFEKKVKDYICGNQAGGGAILLELANTFYVCHMKMWINLCTNFETREIFKQLDLSTHFLTFNVTYSK